MSKNDFPPNVPPKLIRAFHHADDKFNELARQLDINVAHVWNLLKTGKEPRRKDLRHKLFLPAQIREDIPGWVVKSAEALAILEASAQPTQNRTYNRKGKRVR